MLNHSHLPLQEHNWSRPVYGNVKEEVPKTFPNCKGLATTFLANLLHDIVIEKSVTAVLHFINTTPIDWYLKRQATVEKATYGSEFVAAKTATEQMMDLRNILKYLGVPIMTKAYMFGDNKSVIMSTTIPQSVLNKRHNMLSYHRVREDIAAKILDFYWCTSDQNKSEKLSKHWEHAKVRDMQKELFEYQGERSLLKPD